MSFSVRISALLFLSVSLLGSCGDSDSLSTRKGPDQPQPVPTPETTRTVDAKCLVGVDWCYPSCADPSSAWKFSSDGTFNYSTTAFGGMSAWGNWTDLGSGQIEIQYTRSTESGVPPDQVIRLTDCKTLRVGSTDYRTN